MSSVAAVLSGTYDEEVLPPSEVELSPAGAKRSLSPGTSAVASPISPTGGVSGPHRVAAALSPLTSPLYKQGPTAIGGGSAHRSRSPGWAPPNTKKQGVSKGSPTSGPGVVGETWQAALNQERGFKQQVAHAGAVYSATPGKPQSRKLAVGEKPAPLSHSWKTTTTTLQAASIFKKNLAARRSQSPPPAADSS